MEVKRFRNFPEVTELTRDAAFRSKPRQYASGS